MQVATILPTPLLGQEHSNDYNMCLYHIVRDNPTYANYFKKLREEGKFVIMDNGAAEGVNPTHEELMEVYGLVEPSEIVLPDVVYDKEETLKRTEEAYRAFTQAGLHEKYQFMAVPQGANFTEWLSCMKTMIKQKHITTIGISKFVTPRYQREMGRDANVRMECVDAVLQEAYRLGREVQIHLLGCWDNPIEIGEISTAFEDKVRGTDSAIAYVYTRAGRMYAGETPRPDNDEIDFHNGTTDNLPLLSYNMHQWTHFCEGS